MSRTTPVAHGAAQGDGAAALPDGYATAAWCSPSTGCATAAFEHFSRSVGDWAGFGSGSGRAAGGPPAARPAAQRVAAADVSGQPAGLRPAARS